MSYINTQASPFYTEALEALENLESPSIGLSKPAESKGVGSANTVIIKQNNTQIQLLITILEKLEKLEERILQLEKQKASAVGLPTDLVTKLQNLTISEKQRPKETSGQLRVFRNPQTILKEEQSKLRKN